MKKSNLFLTILITAALAAASFNCVVNSEPDKKITVELDGNIIPFDVDPEIIDGRTMLPLRKIFEEIGALVKWDDDTQTVSARKNSKTITLTVNSDEMQIDKGSTDEEGNAVVEKITLDVPAQIVLDRTLVPARAISEAFGLNVDWDNDAQKVIITSNSDESDTWKENIGTINLTDLSYTGDGIEISGNQILITAGGDFTLTGTLSDGSINVSTDEKVKLRLTGASITSTENPCIYVENADKAYITVTDGTENYLAAKNGEKGAIYSKDNLEIKGNGTLNITSDTGHGIKASDNLTIENGILNIKAAGDGININDTFKMTDGTLSISANCDGIDSESIVIITGGELNIETTGEPIAGTVNQAQTAVSNSMRGRQEAASAEFEKSTKGIKADWMLSVSGGEINVNSADHAIHCEDEIEITGGNLILSSVYGKGISGHGNVTIDGSDTLIDVTKSTEGLESKNILTINDGTIKIASSDDGINAAGGKSGENMGGGQNKEDRFNAEGAVPKENSGGNSAEVQKNLEMPQGNMPDRGNRRNRDEMSEWNEKGAEINQSRNPVPDGGNFQRPMNNDAPGGGNRGAGSYNQKACLIINGGNIEVVSGDDCIDANGNIIMNGGIIKATKVNGSFSGNNSIFDADGSITVNEGVTLILAGSGGAQASLGIPQNTITVYSETTHNADESVSVKDKNGKTILQYAPQGSFSAVLITSPELELGKTYTVSMGTEIYELTASEQNTIIGTQRNVNAGKGRVMQ